MILAAVRDDSDASSRSGGLAKHSFWTRSSTATPSLLVGLRDRGSKTAKHGLRLPVVCKSDGSAKSRLRDGKSIPAKALVCGDSVTCGKKVALLGGRSRVC